MSEQPPRSGRPHRVRHGAGLNSARVLCFVAVVFTVAAAGSLVLVVLDLLIGRPARGDVFITVLNSLAAFLLRRKVSEQPRT